MKIVAVCSTGLGSSFMIEMKAKKILNDLGVDAEVSHADLGSVTPEMADAFICTSDLADSILVGEVVSIPNIVDESAMRGALESFIDSRSESDA